MERKCKVLLGDNSDSFGKPCIRAMRVHGLDAECVEKDGRVLLEAILNTRPDVVVLDMFLPNLDAIGVIKAVKSHVMATLPRFMVMFGFDNPTLEGEVMAAGADYFFLKPFDYGEMAERILTLYSVRTEPQAVAVSSGRVSSLEMRVTDILHQVGVPAHIKGYQYLRHGIKLVIEQPDMINRITKELYPSIAKHFGTSASKVERAIRHAIEVAWNRGRVDTLNKAFGCRVCTPEDKPTNGEFIAMLADKLSLERSA